MEINNKNEYSQLKSLLVDEEITRLKDLEDSFLNNEHIKDKIIDVFKSAKDRPQSEETQLIYDLIPLGFRKHVQENPEKTIDTLYPILGPLVSKYVSEAMSDTLDSINSKIENQIPIEKMILKVKSAILRVPEEELLLSKMNNLCPKAFMVIEKETGLVKYQKIDDQALHMNPDLFAGLVTALQDFSKDCIGTSDSKLDQIEYGDLHVILEEAGSSFFAFVTAGEVKLHLKRKLRKILSNIIYQHPNFIEDFNDPKSRIHDKFDNFFTTLKNNSEKAKKTGLFQKSFLYGALLLSLLIPLKYSWDAYYSDFYSKSYQDLFFHKSSPLEFDKKINGDVIVTGVLSYKKHVELTKKYLESKHQNTNFIFNTQISGQFPLDSIEHRLKTISILLENNGVSSSFITSEDGVTFLTSKLSEDDSVYLDKLLEHYQVKKFVKKVQL